MEEAEARDRLHPFEGKVDEPFERVFGDTAMEAADRAIAFWLTHPDHLVAGTDAYLIETLFVRGRAVRAAADDDSGDAGLARIATSVPVPILENEAGEGSLDPGLREGRAGGGRQSEEYRGGSHKNLQLSLRFRQAVW
jgi:hypothetical protein